MHLIPRSNSMLVEAKELSALMEPGDLFLKPEERADFFAAVVEQSAEPFAAGTPGGNLIAFNRAFCELTGFSSEELRALSWLTDLTPPEWREASQQVVLEVLSTGQHRRFEKEYFRKDGSRMPIELAISVVCDEKGEPAYIFSFFKDLSKQKERERLNEALNELNLAVNSVLDLEQIWQTVRTKAAGAVGAETAIILLRDESGWVIRHVHGMGESLVGKRYGDDDLVLTKLIAESRDTVAIADAFTDPRVNNEEMKRLGFRSVMAAPLITPDGLQGILLLLFRSKAVTFSNLQVDFMKKMSAVISTALHSAGRYRAELDRRSRLQTLLRIAEIAASVLAPREMIQRALDYLVGNQNVDMANVWLRRGDNLELMAFTNYPQSYRAFSPMPLNFQPNASRVFLNGQPVVVSDAAKEKPEVWKIYAEFGRELGAYIIQPLRSRGHVIGTLHLGWRQIRSFGEAEIDFFTLIGDSLGANLANAWLNEAQRKRVEDLEIQHRQLIDASPDAYVVYSTNKLIYANPAALKMFGFDRIEEMRPQSMRRLVSNEKYQQIKRVLFERIGSREPTHLGEISVERGPGFASMMVEATVIPVIFEGEPAYQFIARDITQRKQMEREMARLDRLNLVGEMAAGIGHEVRNPMTTVRGFLQLLGEKPECQGLKEYFSLMVDELDRANAIITEFLSMAKNKSIDRKKCNLNSIIEALMPLIKSDAIVADKNVKLILGQIPDMDLDVKEIRQLILNLVRNGLEAMPAKEELTIRTCRQGNEVVLTVTDRGPGISPEVLEKIGTPFFTTKEEGTGLGLAVCYSIAARHHADIRVETGPMGSTFSVCFRVSEIEDHGLAK